MSGSGEGAPSPTSNLPLSDHHRRMLLEESGIEPEVAEARGYRTVEKKVELERLGFGCAQRIVPTLLVPVHSPTGGVVLYQSRPDEPRIKDDKALKYETPSAAHNDRRAPFHARHAGQRPPGSSSSKENAVAESQVGCHAWWKGSW